MAEEREPTYRLTEIVGTSTESIHQAVRNGVAKAARTVRHLDWFEVSPDPRHGRGRERRRLPGDDESGLPGRGVIVRGSHAMPTCGVPVQLRSRPVMEFPISRTGGGRDSSTRTATLQSRSLAELTAAKASERSAQRFGGGWRLERRGKVAYLAAAS